MEHLKDYVWMVPPGGGTPEKVSTDTETLTQKMWQGWTQVDPPAEQLVEKLVAPKGDK